MRHPFTFVTGLLLGVSLMYLFDPNAGARRRARLRAAAAPSPEDDIEDAMMEAKRAADSAAAAALNPTG